MALMSFESTSQQPLLPEGYWYHPEGYLWFVLPVEKFARLPEQIEVEGHLLARKSEFHVTVINARKVAREIAHDDPQKTAEAERELQQMLTEYVRSNPVEFVRFDDDLRLATSSERISIAARCMMRGFEGYFEKIRERYDVLPPPQPTHVSLYTLPGIGAVGIDTNEEMESFKKVELPEVQKVLDSAA